MANRACWPAILLCGASLCQQEPEGLFERFHNQFRNEQRRLPDYVCTQSVERFSRNSSERPWQKLDILRFDVALVGDQELYGKPGAPQFFDKELTAVVGRGVVSTGRFGLLARQVFDISTAKYRYRGITERAGRPAHEYDFDVPRENSNYRLRAGTTELAVAFQGTFWIDVETYDLVRLELQAYDIPEELGLAQATTTLLYSRVPIGESLILIPTAADVNLVTTEGVENWNRMATGDCRRYQAHSQIKFDGEQDAAAPTAGGQEHVLPVGTVFELALEEGLDPEQASPGDAIAARLVREVKDGSRVIAPQGARVRGSLVQIQKQAIPFPLYEIGIEFDTLELEGRDLPFLATMVDAGPAAGLLRQSKRMDPVFTKRRSARMDILVRKVQRGAGFLYWDARRGAIPKGLKMKWQIRELR